MRAAGICNTAGRAATMITPLFVIALVRWYGIAGVLARITGLLVVQIIVVALFGVEGKKRQLEGLDSQSPLSPLPSRV